MTSKKAGRSLFNRPVWAAPTTSASSAANGNDSKADFFSRASQSFSDVAAAAEKERNDRRKATREGDEERATPSEANHSQKRRRASADAEDDDDEEEGKGHTDDLNNDSYDDEDDEIIELRDRSSPRSDRRKHRRSSNTVSSEAERQEATQDENKGEQARVKRASPSVQLKDTDYGGSSIQDGPSRPLTRAAVRNVEHVVDLDDDTGHDSPSPGADTVGQIAEPDKVNNETDDEDDEFADLIRKAREKRRKPGMAHESTGLPVEEDGRGSNTPMSQPEPAGRQASLDPQSQAAIEGPVIEYCITSDIPGTRPLVIKRRLGQRLREARQYWCNRNALEGDVARSVVLVWRGQVWFDSMSARDFGIGVDETGQPYTKDGEGWSERDPWQGKIHLEAMTEAQYEQGQARKLQSQSEDTGVIGDADADAHVDGQGDDGRTAAAAAAAAAVGDGRGEAETASEERFRVVMRAKKYEELKLVVLRSTTIQKMIDAFVTQRKIPRTKRIALMFEGELLQPNSTVGQTDIEDLVVVDVHVK